MFRARAISRKSGVLLLIMACVAVLWGCATQPQIEPHSYPGFLMGLFHGFIALIALVGGFFLHIRIYAFPNSGMAYDLGFVIGFGLSNVALLLSVMARIGGLLVRKS